MIGDCHGISCKQFGPRPGMTIVVFMKDFFEKVNFYDLFVGFEVLCPSQPLWSCQVGHVSTVSLPNHTFLESVEGEE